MFVGGMAVSQAASSPVLAVRGCGPGKDAYGRGKKLKGGLSTDSCVYEDVSDSLDESIWEMLPEDIFDLILERLPFAAQYRFRCLCRKWNGLETLSPPPPCTIVSKAGDQNARFYCDSERKWFSLPSNRHAPFGQSWELVDADGGLVCYQCNINAWFWLWVCNPLQPSLSRLIKPDYDRRDPRVCVPEAPKIKLLVDRASRTYKIVAKLHRLPSTAVYESTTSRWKVYDSSPYPSPSLKFFVWGNVVHAYNTQKDLKYMDTCLTAFNMESRKWIGLTMQPEIPSEVHFPTNRLFLSNNNQVMLVLFSYRKRPRPYFSVWKLSHKGLNFALAPFRKRENWEKVELGSERATVNLRGHCLVRASYGAEHLCFTFRDDDITPDGSRGYKCVRYSLEAKSWSVVPWRRDCGESFELHNWEPSLDIDPS